MPVYAALRCFRLQANPRNTVTIHDSAMKLPNASRAIVDDAKVRDYLLSPAHPVGRFKARVFASVGYHHDAWERLRDDLRALAITIEVASSTDQRHGHRFVGHGELPGAVGRPLPVITVWLISSGDSLPRLITVYPGPVP